MHDAMSSQQPLEPNGKHKVTPEGIAAKSSGEENKEKSNVTTNFECNICIDMAMLLHSVVICFVGREWLHVRSEHKDCPLCKGKVTESNIIPICWPCLYQWMFVLFLCGLCLKVVYN